MGTILLQCGHIWGEEKNQARGPLEGLWQRQPGGGTLGLWKDKNGKQKACLAEG